MRDVARKLVRRLEPKARELRCEAELADVERLIQGPTWAERQLALLKETGDPAEVVRRMIGLTPSG